MRSGGSADAMLMQVATLHTYWLSQADAPENVRVQRFGKGTVIYQPGDEQAHIHLIEKGVVKIGSYSPDGDRVVYDVLQPGEFFGDLRYLGNSVEFFEFAKAVTSVTVLLVSLPFFKHRIVHDPVLSDWFNSSVVRRWWKAETRLLHMTRGDIEARLDNLRKEYDKDVRDGEGRRHNVLSLLSHQTIADLTGTTRQTVSRKLKDVSELVL